MARIDRMLNNLRSNNVLNATVVVNVSRNNIRDVLYFESTAVAVNPQTLNQKKTIVIISDNKVVAVAIISRISNYEPDKYKNIWRRINAS